MLSCIGLRPASDPDVESFPLSVLNIITGEEELLKERAAVSDAKAALCDQLFTYRFPGGLEAYLEESQNFPLVGGTRAFIVFDAKEVPLLPVGDSDLLIVVASKKLEDHRSRRTINFPKLKTFDDNNEVLRWILKEGEAKGIDLQRVASALFLNCGIGLRKLSSEIEKLAVITPPGGIVTPDVARSVLCFCADLSPRNVIDAICDGHTARALAYMDRLQDAGDETGWIIAYMQRHVLQQMKMEVMSEKRASQGEIAAAVGLHPFIVKKLMERQLGLWTIPSLRQSLQILCELDIENKHGNPCAKHGLETEIIRMSEEARNVKR